MSELKIKGKIVKILPVEMGTSKSGKEWKKSGFVIDTGAQFNPETCFSLFGEDKLDMLNAYSEGQEVEVSFNVSSREFNSKYYHNLDCWKIAPIGEVSNTTSPAPAIDGDTSDVDSLPF
jgi:hypothetical protein